MNEEFEFTNDGRISEALRKRKNNKDSISQNRAMARNFVVA